MRNARAFLRADAGAGRPDRFSSLRADAAAFVRALLRADAAAVLTPGPAAHAPAVADAEPAAHARTVAAPYASTDAPAEPAPDAGALSRARRPHGRAGPRALSEAHAGAVATADAAPDAAALCQTVEAPNIQTDAAAIACADAVARRPYSCACLRADA